MKEQPLEQCRQFPHVTSRNKPKVWKGLWHWVYVIPGSQQEGLKKKKKDLKYTRWKWQQAKLHRNQFKNQWIIYMTMVWTYELGRRVKNNKRKYANSELWEESFIVSISLFCLAKSWPIFFYHTLGLIFKSWVFFKEMKHIQIILYSST